MTSKILLRNCSFFAGEVVSRFLPFVIAVLAGGVATTSRLQFAGNRLKSNVVVDRDGIAVVKIQDKNGQAISGLEIDQSDPICTDRVATRSPRRERPIDLSWPVRPCV